ncbi:MAG: DNA topoisomerase 3 [Clostridium sp.]|uniref:type IA DNA topoisomerase n=1 Tax=Clostridium sp. TaxID=1506 RepID=UPI002A915AD9|nr:DNA topoisomerase 3 [Clostridium sp.]MDY6228807.1 DNA topoisomerase 3 [Clostridium sp.]
MKVVIAEKPSVALDISKVIGANEKRNGYYEGNNYLVTWCVGHLVENAMPEDYNPDYKKWSLDNLPIIPGEWKTKVSNKTKDQFKVIKELVNREDVEELICGTDSGREGELIFRLVYNKIGSKKPIKRLWISSMTKESIENGFKNIRAGEEFDNLYKSAFCRSKADWIVGLNATRLYTGLYNQMLNVGRVQTPTINLIVQRDLEIENFESKQYFLVKADTGLFIASKRVDGITEAYSIVNKCNGKYAAVKDIVKEEKSIKPSALLDLTSLQREANKLLGFSAQQTLDLAQSLYEKKVITYPRTDSKFLSDDMKDETNELINNIVNSNILVENLKDIYSLEEVKINNIINNKKVSDHHAIIPTKEALKDYLSLTSSEEKILNIIMFKLLEGVYKPIKQTNIKINLAIEDETFEFSGKQILDNGFRIIERLMKEKLNIESEEDKNSFEGDVTIGQIFENVELSSQAKKTQPPKYYTEATLLSAMENVGRLVEDKELKESLSKGLGTPATRAAIIEQILKKGFIKREGKKLIATTEGKDLMKILPEDIKSPELTATWEYKLEKVSNGELSESEFLEDIKHYITRLIGNAKENLNKDFVKSKEKEVIGKCPRCSKNVYEGKLNFYCEASKECGFSLWKKNKFFTNAKKEINKSIAKKLLKDGKVEVKGLYSAKKDKKYDATIVLEDTGKYINFKFQF